MKQSQLLINPETGEERRVGRNLRKLLCFNYLNVSNKTHSCGALDLPEVFCNVTIFPDFLALYSEVQQYHRTDYTGVCFYQYDAVFHGINGLYNAIYYDDENLLNKYRKRFRGVKYFIAPDYSLCGDIHDIENIHRIFQARIVSLWLTFEMKAVVIPNITYSRISLLHIGLVGLEHSSVVAFSTKGHMQDKIEYEDLREAIHQTIETLNLKAIIVYDVCSSNKKVYDLFDEAVKKDIKVIVPLNTLKIRNMKKAKKAND